jgi:serine/threonine protein phosphatase PrpC
MGSTSKPEPVPQMRRRLSLGEVEAPPAGTSEDAAVSEEDRSLMMQLTQSQILDFVKNSDLGGRKYSIGSETDQQGKLARSFSDKSVKLQGSEFQRDIEGIGYACKKGLKPEAPNQDSFILIKVDDKYSLYGVFDGHGSKGHDVSNFVKDNLPKILFSQDGLETDPKSVLMKTFAKTQYLIEKATALKQIDATRSGTTCSVVLHDHQSNVLHIAHVGDSRVVLGKMDRRGKLTAVELTQDHKPDKPEERKRIEAAGGVVLFDGGWNHRVYAKKKDARGKRYPGLNMSRAMGDLRGFHDAGISAQPDISTRTLLSADATVTSVDIDPAVDKFVMLCSDGVWEFLPSQQVVEKVAEFPSNEATQAAEAIAEMSWRLWIQELGGNVVDDITCVIAHLNPDPAPQAPA